MSRLLLNKPQFFELGKKKNMQLKQKIWKQYIPSPLEEVWQYFSRPENLNHITPEDMSFEILSDIANVPMYEGMLIQYRVSPFWGIKMRWVTEIKQVQEGRYFIDEQRFGPYTFWHHQHHFEEMNGGVLMTDILHYKIPFGILGTLADILFVNKRIEEIFNYRKKAVERIFKFQATEAAL